MTKPITVETTINAAMESVWKLWTTPEDIMQWNNPSDDWHTLHVENDVKDGGKFLFRMQAKDGSDGFDFSGTYDKVIPHELMEYTLADGRKTSNRFVQNENGVTIIEMFEPEAKSDPGMQKDFCQSVLNNFKNYAELNKNELLRSLKNTKVELLQALSLFNEEEFNTIPFEGSWTAGQVGEHLLKSAPGIIKILLGNTEPTTRPVDEKVKTLEFIFLDFTKKAKSSKSIWPSDDHKEKEKLIGDLKAIMEEIENTLLLDLSPTCTDFPFPTLGEMTRWEWINFVMCHTKKHTWQIQNIYKSIKDKQAVLNQ
jgi:uncharacterized protein YndB with AHSA1/START domain